MRVPRFTVAAALLLAAACGRKGDSDASATLAKDTALAADLREAGDTAAFSEAADVAMRDIPDSTLPMPPSRPMTTNPGTAPTMRVGVPNPSGRVTTTPSAPIAPTTPAPVPAAAPTRTTVPAPVRPTAPHPTPMPVTPPAVRPAPAQPTRVAQSPAAPAASVSAGDYPTPACSSPAMPDQRRCLLAYLARSDVTLDRNYQAEIRRRRAEAGTPPGAPEPETVQRLRVAQRAWLVYRDTECRKRTRGQEGPLWAPVRARCLGEYSQARADQLAQ